MFAHENRILAPLFNTLYFAHIFNCPLGIEEPGDERGSLVMDGTIETDCSSDFALPQNIKL